MQVCSGVGGGRRASWPLRFGQSAPRQRDRDLQSLRAEATRRTTSDAGSTDNSPTMASFVCPVLLAAALSFVVSPVEAKPEPTALRCGWWDNPTPNNVSFVDRDGAWLISSQGAHEAEGDWPAFKDSQVVYTNGPHGHGCACMLVTPSSARRSGRESDGDQRPVLRISAARARPLAVCRRDPRLKGKEPS